MDVPTAIPVDAIHFLLPNSGQPLNSGQQQARITGVVGDDPNYGGAEGGSRARSAPARGEWGHTPQKKFGFQIV